jgi:hypothetical protein
MPVAVDDAREITHFSVDAMRWLGPREACVRIS